LEESAFVKLRALRGAITVSHNDATAIISSTEELLRAMVDRNALEHDDIVSCIFTCTPDLNAEFPAVAARNLGMSDVPLMCAQELDVYGQLPQVIRVMMHCYAPAERKSEHVYLREATQLRQDLAGAQ
jgi:chorismate mutase